MLSRLFVRILPSIAEEWLFVARSFCHSSLGVQFEGSNDIGVFSKLTNKYCLVCRGGSENFYGAFETELADHIPVVHTSIAGCRFVGRVTVGTFSVMHITPRKQERPPGAHFHDGLILPSPLHSRHRAAAHPQRPARRGGGAARGRTTVLSGKPDCLQRPRGSAAHRSGPRGGWREEVRRRRRRRSCRTCWAWRCSGNRSPATRWWEATACSRTRAAWCTRTRRWRRRRSCPRCCRCRWWRAR